MSRHARSPVLFAWAADSFPPSPPSPLGAQGAITAPLIFLGSRCAKKICSKLKIIFLFVDRECTLAYFHPVEGSHSFSRPSLGTPGKATSLGKLDIAMIRKNISVESPVIVDNIAQSAQSAFESDLMEQLVRARRTRGLTQKQLAETIGLNQSAIARLEKMRFTPQIDTLFRVLTPLGLTLAVLPKKN